jgi:hypothetical protein
MVEVYVVGPPHRHPGNWGASVPHAQECALSQCCIAVEARGGPVPPERVSLALDLAAPFAQTFAPVHHHVLPLLTNLDVARLRALGGVEVRDYDSDRVL